jgi:hypothetical protein
MFEFVDDVGPEKIIEIYDPTTPLGAVVVVDNERSLPRATAMATER